MAWLSFTKLASIFVLGYIAYSLSSFYKIFHLDQCEFEPHCIHPIFGADIEYQLVITGRAQARRSEQQLLHEPRIRLNDSFSRTVALAVPRVVCQNKSYTVQAVLTPIIDGMPDSDQALTLAMPLTRLKVPVATAYNLLSKQNQSEPLGAAPTRSADAPEMHVYKRVVLTALGEPVVFHSHKVPHELHSLLRVARQRRQGTDRLVYTPLAYLNTFVLSEDDLERVSGAPCSPDSRATGGATLNISVELLSVSLGKMRLWRLVEHATGDLAALGFNNKSVDSVRGIFTHTNFYLLVVTFSVAALHLLFDMLSFKNDISFWRAARTTQGLSGLTVMWRCVSSVIVLLYLAEEETSLLVLVPFGVGTLIEFWKLLRVLKVRVRLSAARPLSLGTRDSGERLTDSIDGEGMRYLLWLVGPLCAGGAVYSLLYLPHRSWYSWTVNTMANGVYVFGFLFMTPQLFINYRLKSVAHLPWKALTYKAFNTFIDDFFAFIIAMPTGHRLACFRDDIVFVIYIYQRWLYPVDRTRVNEFGQRFDKEAPAAAVAALPPAQDSGRAEGAGARRKKTQ